MNKTFLALTLVLCFSVLSNTVQAEVDKGPKVVVSIKPLHSLVAGVMAGVAEPQLLMSGGSSPHGYTLRPSEARMLAEAQLIIWVGPKLESFMEKPLATLGKKARKLALSEEMKEVLLPIRIDGSWDAHVDDHAKGADEQKMAKGQSHESQVEYNQHFWLDARLASQIVTTITSALSDIDPLHRQQYQSNAALVQERLEALHRQLQARLAQVSKVPYIVFHDAYHYFETAYGLNAVGSITLSVERKPGAARIIEMREKIIRLNARCVFSEPQFEPRLVTTLIEGTGAGTGTLDPIGATLPSGTDSYFVLMNNLADGLLAGLR